MKTLSNSIKPLQTSKLKTTNTGQRGSTYSWRKLREKILLRDKYTCQHCNRITTELEIDHINTNSNDNTMSNLQSLCRECHQLKTAKENTESSNYFIMSQLHNSSSSISN